jgi:CP family cyanate transporter-like MFS transporter
MAASTGSGGRTEAPPAGVRSGLPQLPGPAAARHDGAPWPARFGGQAILALLVAGNLRVAITSLSPLLDTISRAERLTSLEQSLLSAAPVLCFGLLAPFAVTLGRRLGLERAFALAMTLLAAGLLGRVLGGSGLLLAGTVVASSGIAVSNILVPAYVKRMGARRSGPITGANIAMMGAAAALASLASPTLAAGLGGWREAIGAWALPALLAAGYAALVARRAHAGRPERRSTARGPSVLGRATLRRWGDIIVVTACQSIVYYSMLAWLPSVFEARGMSTGAAGSLLSLFSVVGLPLSLMLPSAVVRARRRWLPVVAVTALTAAGLFGLVAAPLQLPYVWVTMLGLGQGGIFAWVMIMFLVRADTPEETVQLSLSAQMTGFVLAAAGPFALGEIHAVAGSWSAPLSLLAFVLVAQLVAGCRAGRHRA